MLTKYLFSSLAVSSHSKLSRSITWHPAGLGAFASWDFNKTTMHRSMMMRKRDRLRTVARRVAHAQKDRLVLFFGFLKSLSAPSIPVHLQTDCCL